MENGINTWDNYVFFFILLFSNITWIPIHRMIQNLYLYLQTFFDSFYVPTAQNAPWWWANISQLVKRNCCFNAIFYCLFGAKSCWGSNGICLVVYCINSFHMLEWLKESDIINYNLKFLCWQHWCCAVTAECFSRTMHIWTIRKGLHRSSSLHNTLTCCNNKLNNIVVLLLFLLPVIP